MKKKVKTIIVTLVYRNSDDLIEFIESVKKKISDSRVIIVNSYFNEEIKEKIERIAQEYDCDFINIENKGYSYGNNYGIQYARENYNFEQLVISNPDIVVEKFELEISDDIDAVVWAPLIFTKNGKNQNPIWAIKNPFGEYLVYVGFKKQFSLLNIIAIVINKIIRECFLFVFLRSSCSKIKTYGAHGSFMVFTEGVIEKLCKEDNGGSIFDNNMFLFSEENVLARKLDNMKIPIYLTKSMQVMHKEDGSMRFSKKEINSCVSDSFIYYYETYVIKKENK